MDDIQAPSEFERQLAEHTAHLQQEIARYAAREQALRQAAERFRAMVEVSRDWLWEIGSDGCFCYASPRSLEILGYSAGEVLGKAPRDFMSAEQARQGGGIFASCMGRGEAFEGVETVWLHRDGRPVLLESSAVPVFDGGETCCGLRGISRDLTQRHAAETALANSERHLRQIIDLVPHMIYCKDAEGRLLFVNQAVAEGYGRSVKETTGHLHGELHAEPSEMRQIRADERWVLEAGQPMLVEEPYTDGLGARILRTLKVPYTPPGADSQAILSVAVDITEQKRFEQELSASEQKYRAFMENAVDAILTADTAGNLTDANRRAEIMLGYRRDELLRLHATVLHPPEEHARVREVFQSLVNDGDTTLVEHPVLRKDGSVLRVEVAAILIRCGDRQIVQGIFRDVTERRQREAVRFAREQQHKKALVREVHHRIKNNLQGVVGLLREHASRSPELAAAVNAAVGQVQSISVVHGLQGQGDDLYIRLCDMICAIARNTSSLARATTEPEVDLTVEQAVMVDKNEAVPLALVINELILNAVKHSAEGARSSNVRIVLSERGDGAELKVVNTGVLPEGFDYVSGQGAGTGLGLVRSLLPHTGARLEFVQGMQHVEVRLQLWSPVVKHNPAVA